MYVCLNKNENNFVSSTSAHFIITDNVTGCEETEIINVMSSKNQSLLLTEQIQIQAETIGSLIFTFYSDIDFLVL